MWQVIHGDCLEVLPTLPDASVNCCITSPPYFGLRDYGCEGQIGLESSPYEFVAKMVSVFREVRRVLREDGTLWLNLGDSYTGSANAGGEATRTCKSAPNAKDRNLPSKRGAGLKPKDLIGIPWRVAFALQADGWYLRQDIIWSKPNPMPESVTDRCTKAHEYLFLLAKSERYYWNQDAMQERALRPEGSGNTAESKHIVAAMSGDKRMRTKAGFHPIGARETRNRRSVWTVATQPFDGAHFATFPPALIDPCVRASCPVGGTVLDPFAGAGTTGLVASKHECDFIGIELNADYAAMARRRIGAEAAQGKLGFA